MPKQMPEPIPGVCFPSSREDKTCLLAYEQNDCRLLKHQLKFHFLKFLNPWNNTCLPPPHAPLEHFLNIWAYMALFSCVFYDTVWVSDQPGSDTNFNSQSLLGGLIHVSAGVYQQLRAWILAKPLLCASQLTQWRPRVLIGKMGIAMPVSRAVLRFKWDDAAYKVVCVVFDTQWGTQ